MSAEKDYINSLQHFSKSVEYLVEAIKEQTLNQEKDFKESIASSKEQAEYLHESAKKLTVISKDTQETKSNTQEILKIVKDLKNEKKKGFFDKLSPKDKAKNVRDSIKTITLMAGGILAIGTAFKVVGDVDFKSVLALSIALPAVGYAFKQVGETSSDPKQNAQIALSMIIMSGGILGSAQLLSLTPQISITSLISAIGTAATIAIALYGISQLSNNISDKDIKNIYLLTPVMPVLAAGIVGSGQILQNMPNIGFSQFLSTIGVGVAMGASMIPLAIAASMVGGKSKEMLTLSALLPLTSIGLLLSGLVLQFMPQLDVLNIIKSSTGIAASSIALAGTVWALNKMGLASVGGLKTVTFGMIASTIMSGGLMAISHILSLGNYSKHPSEEWAKGVGLSMLGYLPAVVATGFIAMTGIGAIGLAAGVVSMAGIANGLANVSHILAKGNYSKHPSEEWANGVGLSLVGFVDPILRMNPGLFGFLIGDTLQAKIDAIEKVGEGLKNASIKIAGGNYSGGPSPDWAKGVGLSLTTFSKTMADVEPSMFERLIFGTSLDDKLTSMVKVAGVLPRIGKAVGNDTSKYKGGPGPDWAAGSAKSILAFSEAMDKIDDGWFSSNLDARLEGMVEVGGVLPRIGEAIGSDTSMYKGGPSEEWGRAIATTLGAFTDALSIDDAWLGSNLDKKLDQMVEVAKVLPRLGRAVGSDTSIFQGGPSSDWSDGVGKSVSAFINAISSVSGNMKPEEFSKWASVFPTVGHGIRMYGILLDGVPFTDFPSEKWSKGVVSFIAEFSKIRSINNPGIIAKQIYMLAQSYTTLAKSLSGVGDSLRNMPDKVPDVSGLYSGLVTLSLIDNNNLKNVLDAIESHEGNLSTTMDAIISASERQVARQQRASAFKGIIDFSSVTAMKQQQQMIQMQKQKNTQAQTSVTGVKNVNNVNNEPLKINTESLEQKLEQKLDTVTNVLNNVINVLNDIADNTSKTDDVDKLLN